MAVPGYYELYRRSTVGNSLVDALDTLISEGRIEASLAMRVLETFDKCVSETLKEKTSSKLTVKGDLDTYGFCDDVWTFIVKNCLITVESSSSSNLSTSINSTVNDNNSNSNKNNESIKVEKLRIVACNSRKSD